MERKILGKIKNQQLNVNLSQIIKNSELVHQDRYLYSFTDHGINHSKRMIDTIIKLLRECRLIKPLNEYEWFVLVAAVYLHDIGIQITKIELLNDFASKNGLSFNNDEKSKAEFIRKNHHRISNYLIMENINDRLEPKFFFGPKELGEIIAKIVLSHGESFTDEQFYPSRVNFHDSIIRLKLLCVLLSLADALDCDNRRVNADKLRYTELPVDSKIHWLKHIYVSGIQINKNVIRITYNFPKNMENQNKMFKNFFCNQTEYWIAKTKNDYFDELNNAGLLFDLKRTVKFSDYQEAFEDDIYDFIEKDCIENLLKDNDVSIKRVAIGILQKDGFVLMMKRKFVEFFKDGKLEWHFPDASIKTIDTPADAIVRDFGKKTGIRCKVEKELGKRIHPDTNTLCYYFALTYEEGTEINGDPEDIDSIEWIPLTEYKSRITSNLYSKISDYLDGKIS